MVVVSSTTENRSVWRLFLVFGLLCLAGLAEEAGSAARDTAAFGPEGGPPAPGLVRLQAGTFDPTRGGPELPLALAGLGPPPADDYYLVQFHGVVLPEWRADVEALGGRLYGYVADYSYLVKLTPQNAPKVRLLPEVRWVGPYEPGYRVSPALFPKLASEEEVEINLLTFEPEEAAEVARSLEAGLGRVLQRDRAPSRRLRAAVTGTLISRLAQLKGVAWIEEYIPFELANDKAAAIMHADQVWSSPGLTGAGQIVGIADSGLDVGANSPEAIHPDFLNSAGTATRIVDGVGLGRPPQWDDPFGHGTHVAGSVLGNGHQSLGTPSTIYRGMAPEASLYFQSVLDYGGGLGGLPSDLGTLFASAYAAGARIHTNSWGGAAAGAYTTDSRNVDQYAWDHKDMTILFSAGNSGVDNAPADGVVDAGSVGSPGTAKNCITVGASENDRPTQTMTWYQGWPTTYTTAPIRNDPTANNTSGLAAFSGRGPTTPAGDGRQKPDVVAPGTWIISTRTGCNAYDMGLESGVLGPEWSSLVAPDAGWAVNNQGIGAHAGSYVLANGTPSASYAPNLTSHIYTPFLDFSTAGATPTLRIWMKNRLRATEYVRVYIIGYDSSATPHQTYWTYTADDTGGAWVQRSFPVAANQLGYRRNVYAVVELHSVAGPVPSGYYCMLDDFTWAANGTLWGVVNDDYLYSGGTSMSTPLTAGGVALVRQHYQDAGLSSPSSALLKATLIGAADDLTPGQYGTGATQEVRGRPDKSQGWGRVNLKNAIAPAPPARVLYWDVSEGLNQGDSNVFTVRVADTSVPLRVALVWTDPPAAISSVSQLVNDLDLTVTDPSLVNHLPMDGAGDHANNVETVDLSAATLTQGLYTVTVHGQAINGETEPYALVVFGGVELLPSLSVSVTPSDPWLLGMMQGADPPQTTWEPTTPAEGGYYTATNDGSGDELLRIKASSFPWTPGSAPGPNRFVIGWGRTALQGTLPPFTPITVDGVALDPNPADPTSLPPEGAFAFDLQFQPPTSTTDSSEQLILVTIEAYQP